MSHYPVQLLGGIVMAQGGIAEMETGEGKTLTATLPTALRAAFGQGAHVATTNAYLAERDAQQMRPVYERLGLSVGAVLPDMAPGQRKEAYRRDIAYAVASELAFDYLRKLRRTARPDAIGLIGWEELYEFGERAILVAGRFCREEHYIVRDGEIVLVTEATGRLAEGRHYTGGIHHALQTREGIRVTGETGSAAQITAQCFFRQDALLGGTTGTARSSAGEMASVYKLPVTKIPTNKSSRRVRLPERVFATPEVTLDRYASNRRATPAIDAESFHSKLRNGFLLPRRHSMACATHGR